MDTEVIRMTKNVSRLADGSNAMMVERSWVSDSRRTMTAVSNCPSSTNGSFLSKIVRCRSDENRAFSCVYVTLQRKTTMAMRSIALASLTRRMGVGLRAAGHSARVRFVGRVNVLMLLSVRAVGEAAFAVVTLKGSFATRMNDARLWEKKRKSTAHPVCVRLCILRFSERAKILPQRGNGHGNGFSPVCTRIWLTNLYLALNARPCRGQSCQKHV